jgi:hypothetical protein
MRNWRAVAISAVGLCHRMMWPLSGIVRAMRSAGARPNRSVAVPRRSGVGQAIRAGAAHWASYAPMRVA